MTTTQRQGFTYHRDGFIATADVDPYRFISPGGAHSGSGLGVLGVSTAPASIGEPIGLVMTRTAVVLAGAAVSFGDLVRSDSSGRATPWINGQTITGRVLSPGDSISGSLIEVLLAELPKPDFADVNGGSLPD